MCTDTAWEAKSAPTPSVFQTASDPMHTTAVHAAAQYCSYTDTYICRSRISLANDVAFCAFQSQIVEYLSRQNICNETCVEARSFNFVTNARF
jgi:hypothetical protein